jgi:enhancing lycopene biosynthesis protein 2
VESARIARGAIKDLQGVDVDSLDAVILPGGFGAAKNLCDFAVKGSDCAVLPSVEAFLSAAHMAGKPIGVACISPVIAARVFGAQRPELTIGDDPGTAGAMEEMGSRHFVCSATEFHVDTNLKIVSTPAYMNASNIAEAAEGIDGMVDALLDMVSSSKE